MVLSETFPYIFRTDERIVKHDICQNVRKCIPVMVGLTVLTYHVTRRHNGGTTGSTFQQLLLLVAIGG